MSITNAGTLVSSTPTVFFSPSLRVFLASLIGLLAPTLPDCVQPACARLAIRDSIFVHSSQNPANESLPKLYSILFRVLPRRTCQVILTVPPKPAYPSSWKFSRTIPVTRKSSNTSFRSHDEKKKKKKRKLELSFRDHLQS